MPKGKLVRHPLSAIFPDMRDEDFGRLRKSIREKGYLGRKEVVLLDGMVLDGWNRYNAALEEGIKEIEIPTRVFKGGDPIEFVMSENLARRHMTSAQAAAAAADLAEAWKKAEEEEKAAAAAKAKKAGTKPPKTTRTKGSKVAAAAAAMGVSPRSVAAAAKVKKKDPKKFAEIKAGKSSVHKAGKAVEVKLNAEQRASKAFEEACARIDKVCGGDFSKTATKKLNSKEVIKMSGLDKDEMLRIKPFIESGWKLTQAIGWKSTQLTHAHTIRQLLDNATAKGGTLRLEIGEYVIDVAKAKK